MNVVGRVGSFISQGVYSVATPFHPFGGAVDIIVVKQNDGSYRSTPWYVRFGKFQGVLKGAEKLVKIEVNGTEADFEMHLDNSGEAYFVKDDDPESKDDISVEGYKDSESFGVGDENIDGAKEDEFLGQEGGNSEVEVIDERATLGLERLNRVDSERIYYEFQDEQSSLEGSVDFSEYDVDSALKSPDSSSEVVLVSVDGHVLMAPISSAQSPKEYDRVEETWTDDYLNKPDAPACDIVNGENDTQGNEDKELCAESVRKKKSQFLQRREVFKSCSELHELLGPDELDQENTCSSPIGNVKGVDVDDPNKKSSMNEESEVMDLEVSRDSDALSVRDSVSSRSVSFPQELLVEVEAVTQGESNLDINHEGSDINDDEISTRVEIDQSVKSARSGLESPRSDVCSKSNTVKTLKSDLSTGLELSLCGKLLHPGMGSIAAQDAFNANRISSEEFNRSATSFIKNADLTVRLKGKYLPYGKAAHIILGMAAFGLDLPVDVNDIIPVEKENSEAKEDSELEITPTTPLTPSRRWRLWPIPFRRVKTLEHSGSGSSNEDAFVDSGSVASEDPRGVETPMSRSPRKQIVRTNVPTTDQIESLNLREGQNMVNFIFSTRVLGCQKVEAHIYLWKWNTRIVISDVDGTITKSDVLGQFMPLVGKDWTHTGIAHLFCAIKENGYQLLFLSARAIVQAYLTKNFLSNLKQDGKSLPSGPVVISPDGLFPSLYREVIRRAPHEFKIACLEDIKALFPPDYNPFYAGFGNRDTDELSYRKIGIPKGKIFIINPKGEVAINNRIDVKSYISLHTLVNDMFPPTSLVEQEDYNSWNYWKMPLPDIE